MSSQRSHQHHRWSQHWPAVGLVWSYMWGGAQGLFSQKSSLHPPGYQNLATKNKQDGVVSNLVFTLLYSLWYREWAFLPGHHRVSCFLASFWIYLRMYNDIFPTWFWLVLSEMRIESLCLRSDRFYSFYYWTSSLLLRKNYFLLAFDLHFSPFFVMEPGVVGHSCFCAKLICFFTFAFIVMSLNYSLPSNPMWFCSVFFPKQLGSMVICFFFARSGYCFMLIPWKNYCTTQENGKHTTQKCNFFSYREALIHFKYSHLKNSI